jgi:hypothetical protein
MRVPPVGWLTLMSTPTEVLSTCEMRPSAIARMIVRRSDVQMLLLKSMESLFVIELCLAVNPLSNFASCRKKPFPVQQIEFGSFGRNKMEVTALFATAVVPVLRMTMWLRIIVPVLTSK